MLFGVVLNQNPLYNGRVGFALRFHEGSAVDVHRGRDVGVTHEFLLHAERRASLVEPGAVAVTQRVPADLSLNLRRDAAVSVSSSAASQNRRFVCSGARKDPVSFVLAEPLPFEQNGCDVRIQRQFVLGALGLQLRDLASSITFSDFHDQAFEVDSAPAQAHDFADTKSGTPGEKDHTAIRMDKLIEQSSKLLLGQNARRLQTLADSL